MHQAVMAVATGSAKAVVVYRALNGRSGARYSEGVSGGPTTSDLIHWSWYMPSGLMTPASWVAMYSMRYMHETGCTSEDFAEICLAQRRHAIKNPRSFFHNNPLTIVVHPHPRALVDTQKL
jgi:acetyl-CoA acetyltransferase